MISYENHRKIAFYIGSFAGIIYFINDDNFNKTIDYIEKNALFVKNYFIESKHPDFFDIPIDDDNVELVN